LKATKDLDAAGRRNPLECKMTALSIVKALGFDIRTLGGELDALKVMPELAELVQSYGYKVRLCPVCVPRLSAPLCVKCVKAVVSQASNAINAEFGRTLKNCGTRARAERGVHAAPAWRLEPPPRGRWPTGGPTWEQAVAYDSWNECRKLVGVSSAELMRLARRGEYGRDLTIRHLKALKEHFDEEASDNALFKRLIAARRSNMIATKWSDTWNSHLVCSCGRTPCPAVGVPNAMCAELARERAPWETTALATTGKRKRAWSGQDGEDAAVVA
jgi:hypothetical protein